MSVECLISLPAKANTDAQTRGGYPTSIACLLAIPPSHRQARRRRRKFNAGRVLVRKTLPAWTLLAWASRRNRASPHAARPPPRGLHSSTSQLDLSRVCHQETPDTPYTPPNTPLTRATQPLMYTP